MRNGYKVALLKPATEADRRSAEELPRDTISLEGWNIGREASVEWQPWGGDGFARAKVLAVADGFHIILVEAAAGYRGGPHEHVYPEFLYVIAGTLRTQGQELIAGDAYAAASGSVHQDFVTDAGATYLTIFKV